MGRIPTSLELARRAVPIQTVIFAWMVRTLQITSWLIVLLLERFFCGFSSVADIPLQSFNTVKDVVNFAVNSGRCPKKRKIMITIIYGFFWHIWKSRNDKIFNKVHISPSKRRTSLPLRFTIG